MIPELFTERTTGEARGAGLGRRLGALLGLLCLFIAGTALLRGSWKRTTAGRFSPAQLSNEARRLRAEQQGGIYLGLDGVTLQEQANDCGAAAMKMIFDQFGFERPLSFWQQEAIDRPDGSSMKHLSDLARRHALHAEGWQVRIEDLPALPLPAIALLRRNHYVVLEYIDSRTGEVEYADPSLGRVRLRIDRFHRLTRGTFLLFRRRADEFSSATEPTDSKREEDR